VRLPVERWLERPLQPANPRLVRLTLFSGTLELLNGAFRERARRPTHQASRRSGNEGIAQTSGIGANAHGKPRYAAES
jgi:hypothetical protein